MSLAALEALTSGVRVRCEVVERDRHVTSSPTSSRPIGFDIGRRLGLAGWALAYRRYSTNYVAAEDEAFQLIGLGQGGDLRYAAGRTDGEDNIQAG
jgi:hypothetical protein